MNLETPKAGAKHELLFNEPASGFRSGFAETSKSGLSSTIKCDQIHSNAYFEFGNT